MNIHPEELEICLKVLQQISEDPAAIGHHARLKSLIAKIHKEGRKSSRLGARQRQQAEDRSLQQTTLMVLSQRQQQPSAAMPYALVQEKKTLTKPIRCYICKEPYTQVHFFYHLLCPKCAAFNYEKRHQHIDLSDRVALVTGGRIKIGYKTALRMLRDGARVIVTTRFPHDCARRYSSEPDFAQWRSCLQICGLDLRNIPAVEAFVRYLKDTLPALDIIINNAAQTIKRPLAFYQHLLEQELQPPEALPAQAQSLIPYGAFRRPFLLEDQSTFPRGTLMPDGRLDLCKQGIGAAGCRLITEALTANTRITSLLLGTDGIGNLGAVDVARLIERNHHLEIVYLGCNFIEVTGMAELAQALSNNKSVTGLWLKRNPIGEKGARYLAEMLRHNRSIRTLDLVNTQIGREGLAALVDVLIHENRTIERLYLGGNQIDAEGALLLATLLRQNPAIKALLLNVNHLGDRGTGILADALRENKTLVELGVASNGISSTGGIALIEAIQVHPALTHLDLGYSPSTRVLGARSNSLGDAGSLAIGKFLMSNQTLLRMNLRCNGITECGKAYLIAGLEQNARLHQLILDGKQNSRIAALLERNRALNPSFTPLLARDVALIRSVYRTA